MILHSLNPGLAPSWWAVHAETLTPVHITVLPNGMTDLRIVRSEAPTAAAELYRSHPERNDTTSEIARDVIEELCRNFKMTRPGAIAVRSAQEFELPEYLLLAKASGECPGIFLTGFPTMIIPSLEDDDRLLGMPSHWIVNEDLSGEGWAFYFAGCQQAFDELAPQFIAAAESQPA